MLEQAAPAEWVKEHFINIATRNELDAPTALAHRVVAHLDETP